MWLGAEKVDGTTVGKVRALFAAAKAKPQQGELTQPSDAVVYYEENVRLAAKWTRSVAPWFLL